MDNFAEENGQLSRLFSSHDSSCLTAPELANCLRLLSKHISHETSHDGPRHYFKTNVGAKEQAREIESSTISEVQDLERQEPIKDRSMFSLTALSILDALEREEDEAHPHFAFDLTNIPEKHDTPASERHDGNVTFAFAV